MQFRPICAIAGCGGLGIYRCGECLPTPLEAACFSHERHVGACVLRVPGVSAACRVPCA